MAWGQTCRGASLPNAMPHCTESLSRSARPERGWRLHTSRPSLRNRGPMCGRMPTFRYAFHRRRCIVPVDGFFEWPYTIAMKDGSPFGFGGLWENSKDPKSGEWMSETTFRRLAAIGGDWRAGELGAFRDLSHSLAGPEAQCARQQGRRSTARPMASSSASKVKVSRCFCSMVFWLQARCSTLSSSSRETATGCLLAR